MRTAATLSFDSPSSLLRILALIMGLIVSFCIFPAEVYGKPQSYLAIQHFTPVTSDLFVPYYAETRSPNPSEHGLAINTAKHGGRPAAAELSFRGSGGTYTVVLWAVAEEDGESRYVVAINDTLLADKINPETTQKRLSVPHRWTGVKLAPGDRIRVTFRGHSNGKIREGTGHAWSRGRWRALELIPEPDRT